MTEVAVVKESVFAPEGLGIPEDLRVVRPIGVELFLAGKGLSSNLPAEIASDARLLEPAAQRRKLYSDIGGIFDRADDVSMNIDDSIDRGLVGSEEVARVYDGLSDFIEADKNNTRIILYLPVQLLPNLKTTREQPDESVKAKSRFGGVYRDAWIRLLHESDPRASFVDGDVLEPGLGEPPRVRKAGHLTAEILELGIIEVRDIIDLLEISKEDELLESLTEGIIVARDKGLIDDADWQVIQGIGAEKSAVANLLNRLSVNQVQADVEKLDEAQSLEAIVNRLDQDLEVIDQKYSGELSITPARAKWIRGVEKDRAIDQAASELTKKLQAEEVGIEDLRAYGEAQGWTDNYSRAVAMSIFKAGEIVQGLAENSLDVLQALWADGSSETRDRIMSGLSHWRKLDVIQDNYLTSFGISLPDLSLPFPVDLEKLSASDLREVIKAVRKIKESPELSKSIYPFMLVFGSRIKGYATLEADTDGAIFVRPDTLWGEREDVIERLDQEVPEVGSVDNLLEFWMKEEGGNLAFRDIPKDAAEAVVGLPQVHFFFNGVWVSGGGEQEKLYQDVLKKYLDLSRFGEEKDQKRYEMLRRIELDMLQYRLMHKGYSRLYPNKREKGTKHADLIDWESDFWDPGYRRVATKLFLSRVFLPDLS